MERHNEVEAADWQYTTQVLLHSPLSIPPPITSKPPTSNLVKFSL